ncbi:MAG: aminotransferase class III-fold pyridoxal phosphate-dependent enzyme [Desulfovibrionaceae bacterium]
MATERTMATQERAKARIPGLTQLLSKRPDRFSMGVWPAYYSKAKGAEVWDLDGNKYLDMSIGGIGATVLGYADPDVDAAVIKAIHGGVASSLNCPEEVDLAERLCGLHPWADMVRYTRAGGEAMTVAVRIARAKTGRDVVAFCGYHGWHDWYLAANVGTENALGEHLIAGLDPAGVPRGLAGTALPFNYNRLDELEAIVAAHGKDLAAIVMEPIRNFDPDPAFIAGVERLARETGAVWILDEISAGFRFRAGGAHVVLYPQHTPDMAVFSKALGNGYPISAIIGTAEVMDAAQHTFISSTNWTERTGLAAALATIDKYEANNVQDHLNKLGGMVQEGWREAGTRHGLALHAGGMKAMSHFAFEHPDARFLKAYYVQLMLDRGILASDLFYAMFAHTDADVDRYLAATDEAFAEIARALEAGNLNAQLRGEPSLVGFKRLA